MAKSTFLQVFFAYFCPIKIDEKDTVFGNGPAGLFGGPQRWLLHHRLARNGRTKRSFREDYQFHP